MDRLSPSVSCALFVLTLQTGCGPEDPGRLQQPVKPSSTSAAALRPMAVQSVRFQKRWAGTDPSCFAVDDQYSWTVAGSLRPGESYTFDAIPTCDYAEMPVIVVKAIWDASDLEVTTVVPANDGISDDGSQAGTPIVAAHHANEAHLCMFTSAWGAGQGYQYSITIRNKGSQTAYDVTLRGQQANGWFIYFNNQCARADADQDGWNDALEHGMQLMTYYASYHDPSRKAAELDGTNYLRATPGSATPDDEADTYPPDVNDDGVVDPADVAKVASFVGQGSGVSLDRIDANPGPNSMYSQAGPWRRYDLDGNGYVDLRDVGLVEALVGQPIPLAADILAPTVELRAPSSGATVARGGYQLLEAFAFDNRWITKVDFYANHKLSCSASGGSLTLARQHQFSCWWQVPRKRGAYTLTAKGEDSAGNTATDSVVVHVQ